jgi:NAD(P)-dependent dehydrogenase (short-subunit alcohol dehydrogenase family)
MLSLKNRVILITGASSGIGRAMALRFAGEGARLVLTYHRKEKEAQETGERCERLGAGGVMLLRLDVARDGEIAVVRDRVTTVYGAVDALINNAGTAVVKKVKDHTFADIKVQIRTNLEGLIKVTRVFIPLVREMIMNVGSALGKEAMGNYAVYCATKFGVRGFTQALAQELPHLRVCCLNPDLTATPLTGFQGRAPEAVADVAYRLLSGQIHCGNGGDVDVWDLAK